MPASDQGAMQRNRCSEDEYSEGGELNQAASIAPEAVEVGARARSNLSLSVCDAHVADVGHPLGGNMFGEFVIRQIAEVVVQAFARAE